MSIQTTFVTREIAYSVSLTEEGERTARLLLPLLAPRVDGAAMAKVDGELTNLEEMSCSCAKFAEKCARWPANDLRRVCDHLGRRLARVLGPEHEPVPALLGHGYWRADVRCTAIDGEEIFVAWYPDSPWVNVYARTRRRGSERRDGPIGKYGFHLLDRRWSYGATPRGLAVACRELVLRMFNVEVQVDAATADDPPEPEASWLPDPRADPTRERAAIAVLVVMLLLAVVLACL